MGDATRDPRTPRVALLDRFWSKVDKNGPVPPRRPDLGSCWLWTAANTSTDTHLGYGVFADAKRRQRGAHACSYIISGRVIPNGYEVDHLCMVRLCVNPAHLEAVTQDENRRRADVAYGIRSAKTRCPQGHEYSPENTMIRKCGRRRCRACGRDQFKRWDKARRATPTP